MSAPSRRDFLGALGAAALVPARPGSAREAPPPVARRGLERAPGDFLLDPDLAYLQTASLGPTPRPVMDAVLGFWQELERNPTYFGYGAHEQAMEAVRAQAARFIGCATEEMVLTGCTTDGMNLVASGLGLRAGDHVLTTDQEHPGGRAGWTWLAQHHGVRLESVPLPPALQDPQAIVDAFAARITPRTRVLMASHVLTSTGLRLPVAGLSALARARGALMVVDGAQAVGGIAVDVKALGCHAYVTSGHKWMCGPKGTGLLYLADELGDRVQPVQLQAGRAAYSASNGVRSLPSVLGLGTAIGYLEAIGLARIESHGLALRNRAFDGLRTIPRLTVVSPPPGPRATPIVTWALPGGITGAELQRRLHERHGVFVKVVPAAFLNGNRVSTHLFNTEDDVDRMLRALRAELA